MKNNIAISLKNISKEFPMLSSPQQSFLYYLGILKFVKDINIINFHKALEEIDLEVYKGERLGLMGYNGAGKSTLLKIIAGLLEPSKGTRKVFGNIQTILSIGATFNEEFTGLENIRASILYNNISSKETENCIQDILDFAELEDFINRPVRTYSLGMKMRLQFATATAVNPDILIIDEALGAGDSYFVNKSMQRIKNLVNTGCTLILVTHSPQHIQQLCNRAIFLEKGKIILDGPTEEVLQKYMAAGNREKSIHKQTHTEDWVIVPRYKRPIFIEQAVIKAEEERLLIKFNQSNLNIDIMDVFCLTQRLYIKNCELTFKCSDSSPLYVGKDVKMSFFCDFTEVPDSDIILMVRIYDVSATCVAEFSHAINLDGKQGSSQYSLLLSPLILGAGDYQIACTLQTSKGKIIESYSNLYSFLISFANESDPPLFHLPGEWKLGLQNNLHPSNITPFI